jgi:hypothetical protein
LGTFKKKYKTILCGVFFKKSLGWSNLLIDSHSKVQMAF